MESITQNGWAQSRLDYSGEGVNVQLAKSDGKWLRIASFPTSGSPIITVFSDTSKIKFEQPSPPQSEPTLSVL